MDFERYPTFLRLVIDVVESTLTFRHPGFRKLVLYTYPAPFALDIIVSARNPPFGDFE
jgi:hypothetical protein